MKSNIKKENQTKMQKLFPEYYGQKVILIDHDYVIDLIGKSTRLGKECMK